MNEKDPLLEALIDEMRRLKGEVHRLQLRLDALQDRLSDLELKWTVTEVVEN